MAGVQRWLDAYVAAWRSYDPAEIKALFTQDVVYHPTPYDEPLRGREAIAKAWIAEGDPPSSWTADYQAVAVNGEVGVGRGVTPTLGAASPTIPRTRGSVLARRTARETRRRTPAPVVRSLYGIGQLGMVSDPCLSAEDSQARSQRRTISAATTLKMSK